ncbi:Lecithin:cholesterol acyltransferase-domain-containing protein [Mrakia frigida]|uniref:phospholipid:diacylglycerol acyltransferase n=1 Tax=Mrakia frigida TaxID=29902 RepID=UPI003FCC07B9
MPSLPRTDVLSKLSNFSFVNEGTFDWMKNRDFEVGEMLREEGLSAVHPVILIPRSRVPTLNPMLILSCSWSTTPDARPWFRRRLWGSASMIRAVVTDKEKWVKALSLDLETGLDPPGQKVRAAQGFDAASQFIQGYWVWAKIIENLAPLNYDSNNLELAAYDWRLSYCNLETRDAYFSSLKSKIELFKKTSGKKVVLVGHSMGGTIIVYFMKWVEASGPQFGNGGPNWVEDNIESFVNIAGPMLGVAKAMTAFLSGEMRDTVEVNPAASYMLEKMFSRKERAGLFQSWAGSASMWIKGGDSIWGDSEMAPDDPTNATDTHGRFISFRHLHSPTEEGSVKAEHISPNLTMSDSNTYVLEHTPPTFQRMFGTNYSAGMETDVNVLKKNGQDHTKWTNPLEVQLPYAPSMKIYCLYGHGKDTERSYWYVKGKYEHSDSNSEGEEISNDAAETTNGTTSQNPLNFPLSRDLWIDSEVTIAGSNPSIRSGVKFGEGDGTVPLLSLGAMCVEGWKRKEWNPAGIKVVTREQSHLPEALDLRGGTTTGDHIDILGSRMVNEAVGRIAAGRGHELEDHFVSDIHKYTAKMDWTGGKTPSSDSSAGIEEKKKGGGFWSGLRS